MQDNEFVGIETRGLTVPDSGAPAPATPVPAQVPSPMLANQAPAPAPAAPVANAANEFIGIENQVTPPAALDATAAQVGMFQARDKDPDRAARVLGLSKQSGFGPELVDRQYDRVSRDQSLNTVDFAAMANDTPALTRMIADPYRAAAVKDDLPALSKVEDTVREQSLFSRAMTALDTNTPSMAKLIAEAPGYLADAFTAKENLKVKLINMINEASGSSARMAEFKTPDILHNNPVSASIEDAITLTEQGAKSGLASIVKQVAHAPGYASDLYVAQRNLKTGLFTDAPPLRTPRYLHDNPVTRFADSLAERAAALSPEASQSTIKLIAQGDYAKAGRTAYYNLIVNAPNLAVMMTMGRLQMAAEVAAYAASTTGAGAAAENAEQIRAAEDQASIPPALRDPNVPVAAPLNPDLATAGAFTKGAAEALFEHVGTYLPLQAWENAVFKAGGKASVRETVMDFSKTMLRTIFSNATEEGLTQGAQDLTDYYTNVNPNALDGIGLRMADAALIGGVTGGALVSPAGIASGYARQVMAAHQEQQATAAANFITEMAKASDETKTAVRAPDVHSEFVRDAAADSEAKDVQIAPEALEKYFQSKGENPTAIMQQLGILPEYGAAKELGTNVKIPLEKFVDGVIRQGHPELANDVKFNEEALSVNEVKAEREETARAVAEADKAARAEEVPALNAKGLTPEQQFQESAAEVNRQLITQLEAAGQGKEQATIMQKILETGARRLGVDPLDLYNQLNLNIRGPDQATGRRADAVPGTQVLNQSEVAETLTPSETDTADLSDAKAILREIDTPEKAVKLPADQRTTYLWALNEVYGDRATRAESMGFDRTVYHGNARPPIDQFDPGQSQHPYPVFVSEDESVAQYFAERDYVRQDSAKNSADVMMLKLRGIVKDPRRLKAFKAMIKDKGSSWQSIETPEMKAALDAAGVTNPVVTEQIERAGYMDDSEGYRTATNIAVGDPSSLRLAHAAFDPRFGESTLLLAQSDEFLRPTYVAEFHSKLISTVETKMPNAAPVDQVRAILKDVKAEEKKWLGLDDFLKDKTKVTKQELLEFLRGNQLEIQEVTKGATAAGGVRGGDTVYGVFHNGEMVEQYADQDAAREAAKNYEDDDGNPNGQVEQVEYDGESTLDDREVEGEGDSTKYSTYTLPGGENYREVLFTLPSEYEKAKQKSDAAEIERLRKERVKRAQTEGAQDYTSSHWDEANILAFTRLNDRVDADGKRVLHIEEVQSDWHQDGRKKGYQGEAGQDVAALEAELKALPETQNFSNYMKEHRPDIPTEEMSRLFKAKEGEDYAKWKSDTDAVFEKRIQLQNAILGANRANNKAVPDAPFRKTWHEFALKKIIRMAAEGGYDRITWTTGSQQGERYNLAKRVDRIQYSPSRAKPGHYNVIAYDLNGRDSLGGGMQYGQTEEQIEAMFGKEIAKKIVADEGEPTKDGTKEKSLSGLQLAVGGEGMKGFYDKIIPDYLRKFGKKYGATVGDVTLAKMTIDQVMRNGGSPGKQVVHSLDITPALKEAALFQGFELFQGGDQPRGLISINREGINIDLLATADRSTFIHESGHFIVEMMKRISAQENAPQSLKDDFAALMNHVGNDGTVPITVEQHEELARSFEAYLMEGKAPSKDLRRTFATIKTWMVDIYRHITGLNVRLTDDVRQVFDRILATDEEIEAASGKQGMAPLFAEPAKYNLTPEQLNEYQSAQDAWKLAANDELRAKLMDDIKREETAKYKAQLSSVTEEVTTAVNAEPVYQAIRALQTGKTFAGASVETFGLGRFKLARSSVVELIGEDAAKELPRASMTRDGGLHPDLIAPIFGYPDGQTMLDAIRAAEPRDAVIKRGVDASMAQLDPKLFQSDVLPDAAMEAIHSENRAKVLKLEMKYALEQSPGVVRKVTERATKRMPTDRDIRTQVEREIGRRAVSELTPNVYRVAERKAAAEAGKALARGDYDGVFEAKRRELINLELYRAAVEGRQRIQKDLKFFRVLGRTDEKLSKSRDTNLINSARAILSAFGIGEEGKNPAEYLQALKLYDPDAFEAAAFQVMAATENGAGNYRGVSYDNYLAMSDAVRALWDLSKTTKEIEIQGRKMQSDQVKGELTGQLMAIAPNVDATYTKAKTKYDKAKGKVLGFKAAMTRVEGAMQALDVDGIGPWTRYIFRPISEAVTQYRVVKTERLGELAALYETHRAVFTYDAIMADELGANGHQFKNKAELLMAVLHSGNESNLQKLLVGRKWGSVNEDGTLDRSKFDQFIARMQATGVLTKADYDFVQSVWDLNEKMKPDAQKAHKAMQGYYFNEITAAPVMTPFGEYRGGYIPAKVDINESEDAQIRADREAFESKNNSFQFPTTGRGFAKNRVEQYAAPLSLEMNLLGNHLDQVLRFTYIEPRVKEVSRLVMDKELRENLRAVDPNLAKDALVPWLQRSATQRIVTPSSDGIGQATDAFAKYIRKGVSSNILVLNVTNGMQQLTGYQVAAAKVPPGYLAEAFTQYYGAKRATLESIYEMSPWMRTTQESTLIEMNQAMDEIITDPSTFDDIKSFASRHGQFLQAGFQNMVNPVVWLGAYNEAIAKGESHEDAVFIGDSAVRTTQGTQNAEDISAYETGTETGRLFKYFASYFNMLANLNMSEVTKISRDVGLKKGAGRAFYLYMMAIALPAVTSQLITDLMHGQLGPDDDEGWAYYALKTYFGSQFKIATAMVPYVGMAASAAYGKVFTKEQYDDRLSLSPAVSAIESAVGAGQAVVNLYKGKRSSARKDTQDVLGAVGLLTQLPIKPFAKPINYLRDYADGQTRPKNPFDFARGIVTGRGQEKRR